MKKFFASLGPAFLILALGIGSGEFILWPYLTANYGFGILWGALLGISLQLFLINTISRDTIILEKNILFSFARIFS
jgi:Mn2+/Fe2+ NRAMP family transporter